MKRWISAEQFDNETGIPQDAIAIIKNFSRSDRDYDSLKAYINAYTLNRYALKK